LGTSSASGSKSASSTAAAATAGGFARAVDSGFELALVDVVFAGAEVGAGGLAASPITAETSLGGKSAGRVFVTRIGWARAGAGGSAFARIAWGVLGAEIFLDDGAIAVWASSRSRALSSAVIVPMLKSSWDPDSLLASSDDDMVTLTEGPVVRRWGGGLFGFTRMISELMSKLELTEKGSV
jgi:hypothetical protein